MTYKIGDYISDDENELANDDGKIYTCKIMRIEEAECTRLWGYWYNTEEHRFECEEMKFSLEDDVRPATQEEIEEYKKIEPEIVILEL